MREIYGRGMILAAAGAVLMAAGCSGNLKPTNAKLEEGLNAYFAEHQECLFPQGMQFPHEVTPGKGAKAEEKRMDAMKAAGLLNELKDLTLHVERYSLTPLGERVAPRFCYGHRVVTSVDGFTPPVKRDNVMETTVTFHARMRDVPVWAKVDELKAVFPEMAANLSAPQEGQMVMATAGVGWSVR